MKVTNPLEIGSLIFKLLLLYYGACATLSKQKLKTLKYKSIAKTYRCSVLGYLGRFGKSESSV